MTALVVQQEDIAGLQYHELHGADGGGGYVMPLDGDELDLLREPGNRRDRAAVAVWWRGHRLGYVGRRTSARLAPLMDAGIPASARFWYRAGPFAEMFTCGMHLTGRAIDRLAEQDDAEWVAREAAEVGTWEDAL